MIVEKIKELEGQINYLNQEDKSVITKAIYFSKDAHLNQTRHSGDPFVTHPIEVAKILTSIKLDASSIAAGLLHDTVEDTKITNDSIKSVFGDQISHLVQGLTKINKLSLKVNKLKLGENYKKLLLAATEDLRVILVKLADRLHNMRTIEFIKDNNKRLNTSMETLEVFSPLAQRLGMKEWQDELEDLSFKSINPDARKSIIDRLNYLKSKDENIIDEIRYELSNIFISEDINCKVDGRIKTPYSIWNKIKKKKYFF